MALQAGSDVRTATCRWRVSDAIRETWIVDRNLTTNDIGVDGSIHHPRRRAICPYFKNTLGIRYQCGTRLEDNRTSGSLNSNHIATDNRRRCYNGPSVTNPPEVVR